MKTRIFLAPHQPRFVDFLGDIVGTETRRREIHVLVDNVAAHKTKGVQAFLEANPSPPAFHADRYVVAFTSAVGWSV
jgi:hypothetical protein